MKWVALLRGINVGGHKKIKMADLRALFEELGLEDVSTYIQSGNVVFRAGEHDESCLLDLLAGGIESTFGFDVPIMLRTQGELLQAIARSPFPEFDVAQEGSRYFISFLSDVPAEERIEGLTPLVPPPETLVVRGREAYRHCPAGFGSTKLTHTIVERELGVSTTTRNWKSILKIAEMSKG